MPRTYSPKKLTSPEARQYADFYLIGLDLEHAESCLKLLLKPSPEPFDKTVSQALLDSALIRYRRCFDHSSKVRTQIHKLKKGVPKEVRDLHQYLLDLTSKHIAHSVSELETSSALVFVAENNDGTLERGGLGAGAWVTMQLSNEQLLGFYALVVWYLEELQGRQKKVSKRLNRHVDGMTDDELKQLPCGLVNREAYYDVRVKRST